MLGMSATLGADGIVRWENGRKWLSEEAKDIALWKIRFSSFFDKFNPRKTLPHNVTSLCYLDVSINDRIKGRILIGLYGNTVPLTCENFRQLCTGEKGESPVGTQLTYKDCYVHRIVSKHLIQTGDIVRGDGRSGESIYGRYFPDENFKVKHDRPYVVSMANSGEDTNQSQFFFTLKASPWLDGKHVAFGQVLMGQELLEMISRMGDEKGDPVEDITFSSCGTVPFPKVKPKTKATSVSLSSSATKVTASLEAKTPEAKRRRRLPRLPAPEQPTVFTKRKRDATLNDLGVESHADHRKKKKKPKLKARQLELPRATDHQSDATMFAV
mmetsp:Transcript_23264/g.45361  ORF Transcript_23264/g.45361 Transcript_23264/m.45361 type:complete len:327 (-) Transcript_23264:410-1390(-)